MQTRQPLTIAILGGTGAQGGGLALRLAQAGHRVVIGSRSADGARQGAETLNALLAQGRIEGADNATAAAGADLAILAVPYAAQLGTALAVREQLASKILIDATVPLMPPKVSRVQLPGAGSAVAALQAELGESVRVVSAFQNVSAHHLHALGTEIDCDVLVCADDPQARDTALTLIADIGMRGINAGPLCNSAAAEALTSLLIHINRHYRSPGAGIRITGLPGPDEAAA